MQTVRVGAVKVMLAAAAMMGSAALLVFAVRGIPAANAAPSMPAFYKADGGYSVATDNKGGWNIAGPTGRLSMWDSRRERWIDNPEQLPGKLAVGHYALCADTGGNWMCVGPEGTVYLYDAKRTKWILHPEQLK